MNEVAIVHRDEARRDAGAFPFLVFLSLVIVAGIAGCGSNETRPERELAVAEAAIDQARQVGAAEYGSTELAAARDKLNQANAAAEQDEMTTARRLAEQAALDAELANAITRNRKAEIAVEELDETIEALREEIERDQSRRGTTQ